MNIIKGNNYRVKQTLVDSQKLVFVFTAMGTKLEQYSWFTRLLNKKGYSVVIYDYPTWLVLKAEFDKYHTLYADLLQDAHSRIKDLKPTSVYAYGVSMGTVLANRLTQDTPEIHHLAMSLTYGDIATNIMHSPATRKTRKAMIEKGVTVDELRATVRFFDPIQNVDKLQGKKVWLHLSKRDKILDYKTTVKTREAFEASLKNFTYTESKYLGHYAAGVKHMLQVGELDKFYKS